MSEYDPLLTMSALNMAIVSLHRITSSGDRLILDREYEGIINNLKMAEINADRELMTLYDKILEVIQKGRLREDIRAAVKRDDSEKKHKSIKEIITGNVLKSFSFNPMKWLGKLAVSSASEYFTQQKEAQERAGELAKNDESQLRLKHEELSEYYELQRTLLLSSWSLLRQYHLPDNYRLTQNALDKFSSAMNEPDPSKRNRMMKYFERDFAMYAPYWFYRAKSANEAGNDDEAGKYFERFGEAWRPVLRKDPYRAESMKYRIESLMRSGVTQGNSGEILKCLDEMRANTELDEWANNIFAGMVYFALGRKDEAEECVMCNIDFGYELEMSGRILAHIETEELPPRIEPLPEKIEPVPVIVPEPPKPEPPKPEPPRPDPPQPEPPRLEPPAPEPQQKVQEIPPAPQPKRTPMSDDEFIELCISGDAVKVEEAIINGANVNAKNNNGMTALMFSAAKGNTESAGVLIKYGADVNANNNYGMTALMFTASNGHPEIAELLLKHGANVNAKDNDGDTALSMAEVNSCFDVAKVLRSYGAKPKYEPPKPEPLNLNYEPPKPEPQPQVHETPPAPKPKRPAMSDEDFIELCKSGNAVKVEEAIRNGANINAKNNKGWTALMWAAYYGHAEVAEVLLKHGADVNSKDNDGWTALMWAASWGKTEVAEVLLKHGADVNAKANNGKTALMWAARNGHTEVAELLLKYRADVNAKDNGGWTALMVAADWGKTEVAEVLIKHGAEVNARNNNGETALGHARNAEVAEILIKHGADVTIDDAFVTICALGDTAKIEEAINNGANVYATGAKTVMQAVKNGRYDITELLLKNHVDMDSETLIVSVLGNNPKITELLLEYGADVNYKDEHHYTALMWAAQRGYYKITEILLKHNADVTPTDKAGWTALDLAKREGHSRIVELLHTHKATESKNDSLLKWVSDDVFLALCRLGDAERIEGAIRSGVNVNTKDKYGTTALINATDNGKIKVVEVLLKHGADIDAKDNSGETALMKAVFWDNTDIARLLLEYGADVDAKDNNGETALMKAVLWDNTDIPRLLLEYGADVNAKDNGGHTVLCFAGSDDEAVRLLRSYGAKPQPEPQPKVQEILPALKPKRPATSDEDFIELCKSGNAVKVEEAISNGANVNAKSNSGMTALIWAAYSGHTEVVKVLLQHGVDVNAKDSKGWTALQWACNQGKSEIIKLLRSY